ncbi:unnamed protein product [Protopolystoma xenopodis]|uniref:Uncharacterized protein n=1 Tax=Protopolystoma xenopodis TaxID=117903 RepID=A0A448X472_9PLAT|nr:unnamed protein product [Protopolystoma xenopodis]
MPVISDIGELRLFEGSAFLFAAPCTLLNWPLFTPSYLTGFSILSRFALRCCLRISTRKRLPVCPITCVLPSSLCAHLVLPDSSLPELEPELGEYSFKASKKIALSMRPLCCPDFLQAYMLSKCTMIDRSMLTHTYVHMFSCNAIYHTLYQCVG